MRRAGPTCKSLTQHDKKYVIVCDPHCTSKIQEEDVDWPSIKSLSIMSIIGMKISRLTACVKLVNGV